MSWCFINHSVIPAHEATVSVQDMGILRGFGVYDGVTVINNRAFRLQDHIHRFRESAAGLGLLVPYTDEEIEQAIAQLSDKMNASRYNVRFILTGGKLVDSLSFDKAHPTFYILSEKHIPLKPEVYSDGASLITHEYTRQYPQFKTINYITAVLTDGKKKQAGAIEVLFTQRGRVLECSTSNIFIVKDNVLITTASDVLKGITRKVVSELMSSTYRVEEGSITIEDILSAEEIFITSSFKDIVPVVAIDGRVLHTSPGSITREAIKRFNEYLSSYSGS